MSHLQKTNRKQYLKVGLIVLALALLGIFIAQVDFTQLWAKLIQLKWRFLIIILTPGIGYLLATLAWRYCLPNQDQLPNVFRLFMIRHLGESLALINPTNIIAGESSKAVLLKKAGINYNDGIVSLVLSRTLIILSHVLLLIGVSWHLFSALGESQSLLFQIGLLVVSLLALLVLFYALTSSKLWLYQAFAQMAKMVKWFEKIAIKIKTINEEMSLFYHQHQSNLIIAFLLSALHWCIGALEFYLIFWFLDVPISYEYALFIELGVMIFKSLGSFVPGQIGVEEYGNLFMLNMLSYESAELWLAISLIRRGRQVFWLLIGLGMAGHVYRQSSVNQRQVKKLAAYPSTVRQPPIKLN